MILEIFSMAMKTYTPLLSEVLKKVNNAKTKDKKVAVLKEHDTQPLRIIIKGSFDPKIVWMLPEGNVPYKPNESEEGTEHTVLAREARKLYHYVKGGNDRLPTTKRETMFIQLLEGLHKSEAELVINAKDKKLHQIYKGLSAAVVKEAFNWNDNFNRRT
tara:strand:+ start:18398 stop:18874 length:477 start_codon:yes stop_codon:yes gene_type:complete